MLYTRTGDGGTSGLYGTNDRFPKHAAIYDALGTLDELNALLGLVYATAMTARNPIAVSLRSVQETLFIIQAELAGANKQLPTTAVVDLETQIAALEAHITTPHEFIIPGATALAAWCDYARTVARRAERMVSRLTTSQPINAPVITYLNRLSSYLYVVARYCATHDHVVEPTTSYQ